MVLSLGDPSPGMSRVVWDRWSLCGTSSLVDCEGPSESDDEWSGEVGEEESRGEEERKEKCETVSLKGEPPRPSCGIPPPSHLGEILFASAPSGFRIEIGAPAFLRLVCFGLFFWTCDTCDGDRVGRAGRVGNPNMRAFCVDALSSAGYGPCGAQCRIQRKSLDMSSWSQETETIRKTLSLTRLPSR